MVDAEEGGRRAGGRDGGWKADAVQSGGEADQGGKIVNDDITKECLWQS